MCVNFGAAGDPRCYEVCDPMAMTGTCSNMLMCGGIMVGMETLTWGVCPI